MKSKISDSDLVGIIRIEVSPLRFNHGQDAPHCTQNDDSKLSSSTDILVVTLSEKTTEAKS